MDHAARHRGRYRQHARATLTLGLPLVGSQVAQFTIQLTDALMLGRYSVEALAAEVLGGTLFFVLFLMGSGFAAAVMPMVAAAAAAGAPEELRRVTRMGGWASLGFGLAALPVMLFSEPLLRALGQQADVSAQAARYLHIVGPAIVPALLAMVLRSFLVALEHTRAVLWVTLAAVAINAGLNWLLIFGHLGFPEMGLRGAAVASLAVNVATLAALAVCAARVLPEQALFARLWRCDGAALARVVRLGWPIGLTSLAEVSLFAAATVMMGWLGKLPLAAHGIAMQIDSVVFMVYLGLSNAATVRAGQAHGRADAEGLRAGALVVLAMAGAVALLVAAVFVTLPETLIALFLDPGDPDRATVLAVGTGLLAAAALFQIADAGQVMALGLLRGVHDTRVPMLIAALAYWGFGVPASYGLGFILGWGGIGVWLGLALGLGLAAALLLARFRGRAGRLAALRPG
ncbi:MAG: MATE family efflux transporter [Roseovarius sp.]